jgi:two-component SAPR family response regulator
LRSRITELVQSTHDQVNFTSDPEELTSILVSYKPDLILFDLSSTDYDVMDEARKVRTVLPNAKLFGIYPHVRRDLKSQADEFGFDYVIPNSGFLITLRRTLQSWKQT